MGGVLGILHGLMLDKVVLTGAKLCDLMTMGMQPADAKTWLGGAAADLTRGEWQGGQGMRVGGTAERRRG
ncbi:hypothetical protein B1218_35645 [Pseudomonas ogarae]|nr:hypothetical protein B1218_35645 [Pseudomonas ogarae]